MFGLLRIAAYGPNSAISLTQTFNRVLFHVCNGRDFGAQKANNGDRRRIVFTAIHLLRNYDVQQQQRMLSTFNTFNRVHMDQPLGMVATILLVVS